MTPWSPSSQFLESAAVVAFTGVLCALLAVFVLSRMLETHEQRRARLSGTTRGPWL